MRPKIAKMRLKRATRRRREGQDASLDASYNTHWITLAMRCPQQPAKATFASCGRRQWVNPCMHHGLFAAVFHPKENTISVPLAGGMREAGGTSKEGVKTAVILG